MEYKRHISVWQVLPIFIGACLLALFVLGRPASAITQIPTPSPIPGSYGIEATKVQPPPTEAASISTPGNGATFSSSPITVTGICKVGLLVEVYNNNVLVGSTMCKTGSYTMQVSLFAGTNELSNIVYDDIGQAGPKSNIATITYTDTNFKAFGALITLTSSYGRRSAAAGSALDWPLQLSGGNGPYAFSIDWGDGSQPELKSQAVAGVVNISHVYKKAGIYQLNVKVTDTNGVSAFIQLVAVANGKVDGTTASASTDSTPKATATPPPQILWVPTAVSLILLVPSYFLGRRSQVISIRNKMLKERDNFEKEQSK
jgi:hypothetical protein